MTGSLELSASVILQLSFGGIYVVEKKYTQEVFLYAEVLARPSCF